MQKDNLIWKNKGIQIVPLVFTSTVAHFRRYVKCFWFCHSQCI